MSGFDWLSAGFGLLSGVAVVVLVFVLTSRARLTELAESRAQLLAAGNELASQQARLQELSGQLNQAQADYRFLQTQHQNTQQQLVQWQEREKNYQDKLAFLEKSREQLSGEFSQLAARILEERAQKFEEQNKQGLDALLKPFQEQIKDFRQRVDSIHTEDNRNQASLLEQIKQLQQLNQVMVEDARHLTNALKGQTKLQGNWGEMILERILEDSGLKRGQHYFTQETFRDKEGNQRRPDVLIRLPNNKDLVIDSKVSLVAYERYVREEDEATRKQSLAEHVLSIRNHIRDLSKKDYEVLDGINTLDFVLLFIPVEGAFMAALDQDPKLYQEAYDKHIVLVSPTTLMVTLRTIHNIWRNEDQHQNVLEIASRAGLIMDQIALVHESLEKVGNSIQKAHESYEEAAKRLRSGRGNLLRQAQDLEKLGAKARKALPEPEED